MGELMRRWMQIMAEGGGNTLKIDLIYSKTLTQDYTTTLQPLYAAEIKPNITFGDFHKICLVEFANNTSSNYPQIRFCFFSLAGDIEKVTTNTKTGGMIRGNYANVRDLELSNDAKCNAGTVLKIYEITV